MKRKIIYYIRLLCVFCYLIFSLVMLDYFFLCDWYGIFFLVSLFCYIIAILLSLLSKKECYITSLSYNFIIIALTFYYLLVCGRIIFADIFYSSVLYELNISYCKVNFLIISLVMLGVVFNTLLLYFDHNNKEKRC